MLLQEPLRVQILDLEITEFWSEPFPQVVLGALGDPAQVAEGPASLGSDLRQLVRAENDQRDHRKDEQLGDGQVEHAQFPVWQVNKRSRRSTLDRVPGWIGAGDGRDGEVMAGAGPVSGTDWPRKRAGRSPGTCV